MGMFADDVCLYARSIDVRRVGTLLEESLDRLDRWYKDWRIQIQPAKCTAVCFTRSGKRKRRHGRPEELWIQGASFHGAPRLNTWESPWTLDWHLIHTNRARQMLRAFYVIMNRRSKLDPASKIQPANCHMTKLQVIQNRVLRMSLDAPWYVRNTTLQQDTRMEAVAGFIHRTARKIFDKALAPHRRSCRLRPRYPMEV